MTLELGVEFIHPVVICLAHPHPCVLRMPAFLWRLQWGRETVLRRRWWAQATPDLASWRAGGGEVLWLIFIGGKAEVQTSAGTPIRSDTWFGLYVLFLDNKAQIMDAIYNLVHMRHFWKRNVNSYFSWNYQGSWSRCILWWCPWPLNSSFDDL